MASYLLGSEHATRSALDAATIDVTARNVLKAEVERLERQVQRDYSKAHELMNDPNFGDEDGIGTGLYWETYFGTDKERHEKSLSLDEANEQLLTKQFSVDLLHGAILQFGKQAISWTHGGDLSKCPNGRMIAGVCLKDLIWEGRNQALHFEGFSHDPPRKRIVDVFSAVASNGHPGFADYTKRNLAGEVVALLGWTTYENYRRDLESLA